MSAYNTVNSAPAPDPKNLIQVEREASKWQPLDMHSFLEGGKEQSEEFRSIVQQLERDPVLAVTPKSYDMTKAQQREDTARRIAKLAKYLELEGPKAFNRRLNILQLLDPQTGTRAGINLGLFLHCVRGNGTAEQIKYWTYTKETAYLKGIYGCFGMTELAHGSNVAGLETTATFDKSTDEFIINTPHIGATKWWIGGAAHSSTHSAVYARLIVDGEDYGVKTFVVPLRDSNHDLMPGVTVGDIGAKMGRDGIDNGWIQFSSVRVPRYFMLQKFCKVSREGEVVLPPLEQLSYSALLGGRVTMVLDSFRMTAKFATIALRYAIGRRQFKSSLQSDGETQLLNYPLHQKRVLPSLAFAYCTSQAAWKLGNTIESTLDELDLAVEKNDMRAVMKSIEAMKSLFIDSAALKSTCTWYTADVIDQTRQACGGHGYSSYNGFGKAYNDWVVQCTWEGDNSVLAMSVGKPLIKSVQGILKGKQERGSLSFLNNIKEYLNDKPVFTSIEDVNDIKNVLKAIEVLIMRLTYQASETVKELNGNFDTVGADSIILSKLTAHHYILNEYLKKVGEFENKDLQPYLLSLGRLYGSIIVLETFSGEFLTYGVLPPKLFSQLTSKYIPALLEEIRPNVIAYTDSFQLTDMVLNSAIGNYDGNIYENYFSIVKAQNPSDPNCKAPYSKEFEDFLNRPSKDVRERFEKSPETEKVLSK
ncbi:uncharacterized protein PRCAT00002331001 [Priceomyces carsonii]|uniref:uncharacterized protein n=1 Tax=Priceomyces carsonii TaxID=28549 RepID=UPI002EDA05EC|nr:unnamed protein product [Priceomyces carsonii]